jgi:hypothetical protein
MLGPPEKISAFCENKLVGERGRAWVVVFSRRSLPADDFLPAHSIQTNESPIVCSPARPLVGEQI